MWHKQCFKCSRCSRFLDSRIACDAPDDKIYCNGSATYFTTYIILKYVSLVCYRKVHGITGYGFGQGGPALLSGDALESVENVPADARLMIDEVILIFQIFLRFVDTTVIPADYDEDGCPRCGGK